jgi:protein SCO1/2
LPTAESGAPFEFRAAEGDVLLVYFGYTSCPDVCPTTMADIARARKALGERGDRVELAMVTIDPDRDTDEVIQGYVEGFVGDGVGLRTGDPAQLQAAADLFGVFFEVTTADDGDVEVLHTGSLFGVDDEGRLVASWPFGTPASDLTSDLELLLGEAAA